VILEILQPFLSLLAAHPYLFVFLGMIVGGELVLLPAIYLAATGRLNIVYVFVLSTLATLISDVFWYWLGRKFPQSALARLPGRTTTRVVDGLERLFARRGPHVLFMSKFVYGTRVAAQVLSGVHDMPFRTYLAANVAGVVALSGALVAVAYAVTGTTRRFEEFVQGVEITFFVFVLVAALGYFFVGRMMRAQWSR
jgi:membrane protein DedA with SNARE-associated domain